MIEIRSHQWRDFLGGRVWSAGADDARLAWWWALGHNLAMAGALWAARRQYLDVPLESLGFPSDWAVLQRHVPVLLEGNEDAEWRLEPGEVDP